MMKIAMLAALVLVAATAAVPAQATKPAEQRIDMVGQVTGPASVAGTWAASGFVNDSGTYTEALRFAGETIHVEKQLVGGLGTITLVARGVAVWTSPCTVTFRAGSWRIGGGTGAYADLKGGGSPVTTADSVANVCTGEVRVAHTGEAHAD